MSWEMWYSRWLDRYKVSETKAMRDAFYAGYRAGTETGNIKSPWEGAVDKQGGSFSQEDIDHLNSWDQMGK